MTVLLCASTPWWRDDRTDRGRLTDWHRVGGGAVWVVAHRSDSLMRIDPSGDEVVATIRLGAPRGENPVCSMCVENVVYAFGSAWTANNAGRSVTRIDAATNEAVEIPVEKRVWAVAATAETIWASQFEELDEAHSTSSRGFGSARPGDERSRTVRPARNPRRRLWSRLRLASSLSALDPTSCIGTSLP